MQHDDFTTLTRVRAAKLIPGTTEEESTDGDYFFKQAITDASALIVRETTRVFTPAYEARVFDYCHPYEIEFNEDLLELDSVTNGNGDSITPATFVQRPSNAWPKYKLVVKKSTGTVLTYQDDIEESITVTGFWGYHSAYNNAFVDTTENLAGTLAAGDLTLTVTDANGLDNNGRERFEVGQLCRLEDELIKVVDRNLTTNVLTIRRGMLGTTPASHASGVDILAWRVQPDIERQCERLVIWLDAHKDSVQSLQFLDTNVVLRDETLRDIYGKLSKYQPTRVYGVAN